VQLQYRKAEQALEAFLTRSDRRSYRRMILSAAAMGRERGIPSDLGKRLAEAVLSAAESADCRLAAAGISDVGDFVRGRLRRKADIITRGLLSKYKAVRIASWIAVREGPRLCRLLLSRLEAKPINEVMVWEVLMAVDQMADYLTSPKDRERLVRFVKKMEVQGTRSPYLAYKIDDTLYCDLHLDQPRGDK